MDKQISPYTLLGVSPTSSPEEIHKAYRHLARRFHPDISHNPQGAQVMARLNDAYKEALRSAHNLAPIHEHPAATPRRPSTPSRPAPPAVSTRAAAPSATSGKAGQPSANSPSFAQTDANARYREGQPVAPDGRRHIDIHA